MSTGLIVKTVAFLLVVPGTVAGVVPLALALSLENDLPMGLGPWRFAGVPLLIVGAAVYLRCCIELARRGQGIPAPTEPTRFLVQGGLYRHMRNPMYAAGSLFLYGEAIVADKGILLMYAATVTLLQHLGVVFLEEPALRKRFGMDYERYCQEVPRWLPKRRVVEWSDDAG